MNCTFWILQHCVIFLALHDVCFLICRNNLKSESTVFKRYPCDCQPRIIIMWQPQILIERKIVLGVTCHFDCSLSPPKHEILISTFLLSCDCTRLLIAMFRLDSQKRALILDQYGQLTILIATQTPKGSKEQRLTKLRQEATTFHMVNPKGSKFFCEMSYEGDSIMLERVQKYSMILLIDTIAIS